MRSNFRSSNPIKNPVTKQKKPLSDGNGCRQDRGFSITSEDDPYSITGLSSSPSEATLESFVLSTTSNSNSIEFITAFNSTQGT